MPLAPRAEHAGLHAAEDIGILSQHRAHLSDVAENPVHIFGVSAIVSASISVSSSKDHLQPGTARCRQDLPDLRQLFRRKVTTFEFTQIRFHE